MASVDPHDVHVPKIREYNPRWEKVGVVTTSNQSDDSIMNFYRRPISESMDVWQYKVQDKHGFEITIPQVNKYIENGENIGTIVGKENKGSWVVHLDEPNKWVYF